MGRYRADVVYLRFSATLAALGLLCLPSISTAVQPVPKQDQAVAIPPPAKPESTNPQGASAAVVKPVANLAPAQPAIKSQAAKPQAASNPLVPLERSDLEAFFDGLIREQLESKNIAGAVVAVVVGDKAVFAKGYGYADVETRRKVDPETTMFRVGSITKTFTWTAVMQLAEQGKLDLNTDVNKYLKDFQVPATFTEPVTLKHCMTHTPGFEDSVIGLFARNADEVKPLAQVLREQMPTRVRPPGVLASYSNHGTALAGLVVATVAGKSWEDSIEQTILKPLGMQHTLVRQPPKDKLPETMSKGYKWEDGRFKDFGFEYVPAAPAGTVAASAADIARFLIAHLNDGQFQGVRILKPETARQMREPLFTDDPHVDAMCYGFWEQHQNGQRILQHGGATIVFHSLLAMIPERHVGLFVSYNTNTAAGGQMDLLTTFLNRYFPEAETPRPKPNAEFARTGKRFEGEFSSTRYSHTTYAKLVDLFQSVKVNVNDDGTLTLATPAGARRYVEVEPLVFQQLDGDHRVVFRADDKGKITHLFPAQMAAVAMVRHEWYQRIDFHETLLAVTAMLFLSAVLFWPALAFSTRGLPSSTIRRTPLSGVASVVGFLLAATGLALVVGLLIGLQDPDEVVAARWLNLKRSTTRAQSRLAEFACPGLERRKPGIRGSGPCFTPVDRQSRRVAAGFRSARGPGRAQCH